jgi:outer membrane lipoprotein carrier protein
MMALHRAAVLLKWRPMRTRATIPLILFAIAAAVPAYAAHDSNPSVQHVLDAVQKRYQDTQSFSASFREELSTVGAAKRERTGMVYFMKPGKMRWNFESPDTETIVSDGTTMYNYDPDLDQVVETPLKQALASSSAAAFILGVGKLEHDFNAKLGPIADSNQQLTLVPKAGGNQIDLTVDSTNYDIKGLTLKDQLGNTTAISFNDIKRNTPFSDSMFAFKVPQGADIVTAPGRP